jgi:hypothetical protein
MRAFKLYPGIGSIDMTDAQSDQRDSDIEPTKPRVGVMIPTYRRPDLARACALQWLVQSLQPHCICVHQNGSSESYAWSVEDLAGLGRIDWIHTAERIPQNQWYLVPLRHLLAQGCTHFFWADHDDVYLRDHAARCVAELDQFDFSVASHCGTLYLKHDDYRFEPNMHFTAHSTGGMSSSMAFTRGFAEQLAADLQNDTKMQYADNVLALATLPRFRRLVSERRTTVYVSHRGSLTSAGWVDSMFAGSTEPAAAGERRSAAPGLGPVLYGTLAGGYQEVTQRVIALCVSEGGSDGRWRLPDDDRLRGLKLGDPAPNQLKHLVLRALPDAQGLLVDRVLRDSDPCTFRYAAGVLSAEIPVSC